MLTCGFCRTSALAWTSRTSTIGRREGAMSELRSALDGLANVDFDELSDGALLELVAEWSTATNRMTAALTSAVRAADRRGGHQADGAGSMKARLRGARRPRPRGARAILSPRRPPGQLPPTPPALPPR